MVQIRICVLYYIITLKKKLYQVDARALPFARTGTCNVFFFLFLQTNVSVARGAFVSKARSWYHLRQRTTRSLFFRCSLMDERVRSRRRRE